MILDMTSLLNLAESINSKGKVKSLVQVEILDF